MEATSGSSAYGGLTDASWGGARRPAMHPSDPQRLVLDLLSALGDVEVHVDHVARIVGLNDAVPALESLRSRRLVDGEGECYRVTAPSGAASALELVWMPQVLDYVTTWYEGSKPESSAVLQDLELIHAALDWATKAGRWDDALQLVRAVDGPLAMSRHWAGWEMILRRGLHAARASGDECGEAWVLHQLGTRALGVGDSRSACRHLRSALALRESLGDGSGAAVSRQNLRLSELAVAAS